MRERCVRGIGNCESALGEFVGDLVPSEEMVKSGGQGVAKFNTVL
jgi:hypothetical protein